PQDTPRTTGGFTPTTQVLVGPQQWLPFEQIRVQTTLPSAGDEHHPHGHPDQVEEVLSRVRTPLFTLHFVDCREQVTTAEDQRFLVQSDAQGGTQWVMTRDLQVGDAIVSLYGTPRVSAHKQVVHGSQAVWSLELSDVHTYFVGQELGLVVHNSVIPILRFTWSIGKDFSKSVAEMFSKEALLLALASGFITKLTVDNAKENGAPVQPMPFDLDAIANNVFGKQQQNWYISPHILVASQGRAPEYLGGKVTEAEFLNAAEKWLGSDYQSLPNGRYKSKDGLRQVRYGKHETSSKTHHGHFEKYDKPNGKVVENTVVELE
ncbi:MAG: hypothetical protein OXT67_04615, partial [Zetaproteobacteria bacterium]|nr:hypothetical protein [Zetaproteobacteria bacterium]